LSAGEQLFGLLQAPQSEALSRLLEDDSPWVQACALRYHAVSAKAGSAEVGEKLLPFLSSRDPLVRETAAWAIELHLPGGATSGAEPGKTRTARPSEV